MKKDSVERWMEPRLVPALLVVTVVFLLALGGDLPRGIAQDARMLLGVAGDVSSFVTHLIDEAERYFEEPQAAERHHLAYAREIPSCRSVAPTQANVMAASGARTRSLHDLDELRINLESINDSLLVRLERLDHQEWPSVEVLEDHPFLQSEVLVRVVTPARAPQPQVIM